MDFIKFSVGTTNIFPCVNATNGGQILSEFNIRTLDSVGTEPSVGYMIGPSYVHGENDFHVRLNHDSSGFFPDDTPTSNSILEIMGGRAIINGHFIESLVSVTIDLLEVNRTADANGLPTLTGNLVVGLKAVYSTEPTMAGTILANNANELYEGIQVVILPPNQFKLPVDEPNIQSGVTAHIKLATFSFVNGVITNIVNNYPNKCVSVPAIRIGQDDEVLSNEYVKKTLLNPKKIYAFGGYGTDPTTLKDTWCDSTDALMVWDHDPTLTTDAPVYDEAQFLLSQDGKIVLYIPHKIPDQPFYSTNNVREYYESRVMELPKADYNSNTAGTISGEYTRSIKSALDTVNRFYTLTNGKQRGYLDTIDSLSDLPPINPEWDDGDYIVVSQDNTLDEVSDGVRQPSSLYLVLPGYVLSITYTGTSLPSTVTGVELARYFDSDSTHDPTDSDVYSEYWDFAQTPYRGTVGVDYFVCEHTVSGTTTLYYYSVATANATARGYSSPIALTGQVPIAQEGLIGGFLNVPETATDYGYVYVDSDGHLRLLDYGLLRSGVLAYQLGEDFKTPSGLTTSEIQGYLDEYVNNRVAFPNFAQSQNANYPNEINVFIELPTETSETAVASRTLNIYNIDSRFGTFVNIHISGAADSNTIVNISDCEKVRIDVQHMIGTPTINLYRSTLYYESMTLNYLNTISDMKLWYQKFESTDANLVVDDMTVSDMDITLSATGIDYWDPTTPNDNHFTFCLKSISFGNNGYITGCSMLIRNDSTFNVSSGQYIIATSYTIPQGVGLSYPERKLINRVKVTGQFIAAYPVASPAGYQVQDTSFTMLSQVFNPQTALVEPGTISFLVNASIVTNATGLLPGASIDGWEPNTFHYFSGSTISS